MTEINILKVGSDLLSFLSKRWWIILVCLIVGLVLGYVKSAKTIPIYKTQLVGEAYGISNAAVVGVLNTLQSSANTNNYLQLTKQTGIKPNITRTIYALKAEIFENTNPTENFNNNVFYVAVSTDDLSKIPSFITGLEQFINNDQLFKGRGNIMISTKFDLPSKAEKTLLTTLLKYGIVFLVLGIGIAVVISFIINVRAYQKANNV